MDKYLKKREEFVQQLTQHKYQNLHFSKLEEQANEVFKNLIQQEREKVDDTFYKVHTLRHLDYITQKSDLYKSIQKLPKGAVLHIHIDCCNDIDWFMQELAYADTTYYNEQTGTFKYFKQGAEIEEGFLNLRQEREKSSNKEEFDNKLRTGLFVQEEHRTNSKLNIWKVFEGKIIGLSPLLYYKENFRKYLRQYLTNFINDGVLHIEARAFLGVMFDENHQTLTVSQEIEIIQNVVNELRQQHPLFTFQIIIQGLKMWDCSQIEKYIHEAVEAKKQHPDIFCGFDMVQEEDAYKNLIDMAPALIKLPEICNKAGVELPFVFHGGESLEHSKNQNIVDAVLMGTKRIGHGLNLSQHSFLYDRIKNDKICIEICPVSNQILKYVDDIRLHPIKSFLNYGIKVSINPDDPGFFGYNGVSMDYYFCAVGPQLDYKDLKLCGYNSIEYSFLNTKQKKAAWEELEKRYQEWAQWLVNTHK